MTPKHYANLTAWDAPQGNAVPSPEPVATKFSSVWLCSQPCLSSAPLPKPLEDNEGSQVTANQPISAATASEIAVETSDRDLSEGDKLSVWVWQPNHVADAKEYVVTVSCSWTFCGKPHGNPP